LFLGKKLPEICTLKRRKYDARTIKGIAAGSYSKN
jgi:hypothetical protein